MPDARPGSMIDLVVCSAAESEYAEALSWYAERSVQAAERFAAEFDQAMETITSAPQRFPRCDERHHYYLMRHFPWPAAVWPTAIASLTGGWEARSTDRVNSWRRSLPVAAGGW